MFLIAAAVTYLLVPVVLRLALAVGAVTQVRERDVHTAPIPRMGGVAMYLGMLIAFLIASQIPYLSRVLGPGSLAWGVLLGAGVMCLVGVLDDIIELTWYAKLVGEILAVRQVAGEHTQLSQLHRDSSARECILLTYTLLRLMAKLIVVRQVQTQVLKILVLR